MNISFQSIVPSYEILLAFDNYALSSAGATVAANSVATGNLVANNLLNPALDTAWRSAPLGTRISSAAGNITLTFGLSTARDVDFVSLHRQNIRVPWRVRYFQAPPANVSAVYDSGWVDPIVRAQPGDFATFSEMPFSLGPEESDLVEWQSLFRLDTFDLADKVYQGVRYVTIEFDVSDDTSNLQVNQGVDFLQVGLPMITKAFRPETNILVDWAIGVQDRSQTIRVESGALLGRRRSTGRNLSFTLGYLTRDEAFGRILTAWLRKHGKLGRVFVWPEPHKRRYFYDTAMVATLESLPSVAMANLELPAAKGFTLEETE